MILLTQPLGDGGFFIPMYHSNVEEVNIGFIPSCSGLQSMIIFVGAIVALQTVPWNRSFSWFVDFSPNYTHPQYIP